MKSRALVFEIARWEFHRWFKWKDQIVTLAISLVLALAIWGGMALLKADGAPVKLSVIGQDILPFKIPANSRIELQAAELKDEERLRELVGRGEIDGLLIIKSVDEVELLVYKEPFWKNEMEQCLTEARTQLKIQELQLPPSQLAHALRPTRLAVAFHTGGISRRASQKESPPAWSSASCFLESLPVQHISSSQSPERNSFG